MIESTRPISPLIVIKIRKQKRKCLCCGEQFEEYPYIISDFCNRCFPIVCKAVFDKSNENLTCKQLVDKVRKESE